MPKTSTTVTPPAESSSEGTPSYDPNCHFCRKRGSACVRHGGGDSQDYKYKRQRRLLKRSKVATKTNQQIQASETPAVTADPDGAQLTDSPKVNLRDAFREALVEVLLERYADQVTAKEVMERLERQ